MYRHPNRRRSKDNPYELEIINNKYLINFMDSKNNLQILEIDKNIYEEFNRFELEDIHQLHQYERHTEHSEIYDEALYYRALNKDRSVECTAITNVILENLYNEINSLSDIQRLRIKKYYYQNMTLDEIAKISNCSKVAVKYSIDIAIKNLRKKLKY